MKNFKQCMLNKKRGTTQKSDVYYEAYTNMFSTFNCNDKLKILEIGVRGGGGLYSLKEYFPNSTIVGLDIDPECKQWESIEDDIHVRIGDQSDNIMLQNLIDEFGLFDIIIDDGSHICAHQIISFEYLFLKLNYNGLYIVEDLHTSYWKGFHDNIELSSIEYFKELSIIPTSRWARSVDRSNVPPLPILTKQESCVDSVYFYDSICFIRKIKSDIDLNSLISNYKQYFITQ